MKYLFEFREYIGEAKSLGILGDLGETSQFGEQTDYFKSLLLEAENLGIDAFVFTEFSSAGAVAWKMNGDNWLQENRPLPTIVYDRSFRKKTGSGKISNTRALTELGCAPINSADFRKVALDKHLMYESLSAEPLGELGLPRTEKYSRRRVVKFMEQSPVCIIKPRFGSGGHGIIKIARNGADYDITYKDQTVKSTEQDLMGRIGEIREKMRTGKRLYIIQECIDLPRYNDGVFDIRVIYQRGKSGKPLRTGMAARLAAPNKITANLHQGGSRETLSNVLTSLFNQDVNGPIAESIREHSRVIFEKLDSKCGPIGEIGIDFLIDQSGKVHLIEVNSIPGRSLFHVLPDIRETAIRRPIEYAQYLLNKKSR